LQLERSEQWKERSQNHLEGRTAAFFCHGDAGGEELDPTVRPKILRHRDYLDSREDP